MTIKQIWQLIKDATSAWLADYAPSMGAALSYYTVFSIAPLLLIVIAVAGFFFGPDATRGALVSELQGLMGSQAASTIEGMIKNVSSPTESLVSTVIGIVTLLIGATTVFGELQDALNRIWRAPVEASGSGLWRLVRTRLLSIGMILGIGFLLMVSLVLSAALAALGRFWGGWFGNWETPLQVVNFLVSFGLVTVLFAMIYKLMPRVRVNWRDVWIGAGVTALLFAIGKTLIALYIGKTGVASAFGAAGSLIVVLVWVYYSAQIFLLGAEFTWVYAHSFGSRRGEPRRPNAASIPHKPDATTIALNHNGLSVVGSTPLPVDAFGASRAQVTIDGGPSVPGGRAYSTRRPLRAASSTGPLVGVGITLAAAWLAGTLLKITSRR